MEFIKKRVNNKWFLATIFVILFLLMTWVLYRDLTVKADLSPNVFTIGADWQLSFRPSSLAMLEGKTPYDFVVWNPPWVFLLLSPIALLPPNLGASVMFTLELFISAWAAVRFGAKPLVTAAFVLSPLVIGIAANGNIDWMVLFGATLPPQFGLFLVLAKPQIGAGIALFWLVKSWRDGGWRRVLQVFAPVGLVTLLSFALYGFWPKFALTVAPHSPSNFSAWPYAIPVGLVLLVHAIRSRSKKPALIAAPLLSPYVGGFSWSTALFGILDKQIAFWCAWVLLWLMDLVFHVI